MYGILDCTLRDGGYYTDWDFTDDFVADYLATVKTLPIDCVEAGYRSPAKDEYLGRYFYLGREDLLRIKRGLRPDQTVSLMLNAKDMKPGLIEPLMADAVGAVDLVRFAVAPDAITPAVEMARILKGMGINAGLNVMYLSKWHDACEKIAAPLEKAGDAVKIVALVDSLGGCYPSQVGNAVRTIKKLIPQEIGFHSHDNLSLAFANTLEAIEAGASMVDTTMAGIGRGAGNLSTELLLVHKWRHNFPVRMQKLASFLSIMEELKASLGWGVNLPYMISGAANLKQADVMEWLSKRRYTASSIVSALEGSSMVNQGGYDEASHPLLKDSPHAAGQGKTCVIVGGGKSAAIHAGALYKFARETGALIIHSSLKKIDIMPNEGQFACLSGHELLNVPPERLKKLTADLAGYVVSGPPRFLNSVPESAKVYQVDLPETFLTGHLGPVSDVDPIQLALAAALALGAESIYLYGYDGYDYASPGDQALMRDIQKTLDAFMGGNPGLELASLLPTRYSLKVKSLYSLTGAS